MDMSTYLKLLAQKRGSDLYFSHGAQLHIKIDGVTTPLGKKVYTGKEIRDLAYQLMDGEKIRSYEQNWECNLGVTLEHIGRFRVNVFFQKEFFKSINHCID